MNRDLDSMELRPLVAVAMLALILGLLFLGLAFHEDLGLDQGSDDDLPHQRQDLGQSPLLR